MDWLNPVEWAAWLYGKAFQNHALAGGTVVVGFFALVGLLVWVKGVDKYREDHPSKQTENGGTISPKPEAVGQSNSQAAPTAGETAARPQAHHATTRKLPTKKAQLTPSSASSGAKVPCDATAAINICNSQDTQIGEVVTSNPVQLKNDNNVGTKINKIGLPSTPDPPSSKPSSDTAVPTSTPRLQPQSFVPCPSDAVGIICNAQGTIVKNQVDYGCAPALTADNTSGTKITNLIDHKMPADACVFYYGGLRLEVPCHTRRDPEEVLRAKLVQWETGMANFWKGENRKSWLDKFGEFDASQLSIDQMCADTDSDSPKLSFFRKVYYGFEHFPD
jgi:hypothetical protein